MCARARARVRACVCVRMCAHPRVYVCMYVCVSERERECVRFIIATLGRRYSAVSKDTWF